MKSESPIFTTTDLWLASYLAYRGIRPLLQNKNDRVVFEFPQDDNLYRLVAAFNMNDVVPVTDYISTLKELKTKMFNARGAK